MQDSVFLDNRTFQRVWQRVAGSTDAPAAAPPEADTLTDLLAECIRAKAAGAAFYTALAQRIRTGHQQLLGIAAHVLKDNLSGFFADLPSVLNRAGKAAESDG